MKKKLLYFTIAIFILIVGVIIFMNNFYTPTEILKTAVKGNELKNENYILCKEAWVTGFDWRMIRDEDGKKTSIFCNIIGANPFSELKLRYEFSLCDNTFIFYIEEKGMAYSEATNQDEIEYVVTGWDILYPIKHNDFIDFFSSKKYITSKDVSNDKTN